MIQTPQVNFIHNQNAKRYIIRIMPDKCIRVTIPKYGTLKYAQKFLNEHIEKLSQKILDNPLSYFEENTSYSLKTLKIKITQTTQKNASNLDNDKLIIKISNQEDTQDESAQNFIKLEIAKLLRKEAKQYIPKKVTELALKHKLNVSDIKVNSAKTRWGSCNGRNSLNFSLFLMQLPYELIDYVILHELSHTIHKNHSSQFYDLLNQLCGGNHKFLNQKLKKFSPQIKAEYYKKA